MNGSVDGSAQPDDPTATAPLLATTNAIVRLYKQAFGRGPTKSRARYAGPDVLVFLLEDGMTVAERNLVALGEGTRVREHRLLIQDALDHEIRALVETMLDRRVANLVGAVDPEHDLTAMMFVLEPVPGSRRAGWADA